MPTKSRHKRNLQAKLNYARKRDVLRALKSFRGCAKCKEKDPRCLDFHHIGPKTCPVSELVGRVGWKKLMDEITQCIVLCANCHRKETLG